jgi:hypothetical protein
MLINVDRLCQVNLFTSWLQEDGYYIKFNDMIKLLVLDKKDKYIYNYPYTKG